MRSGTPFNRYRSTLSLALMTLLLAILLMPRIGMAAQEATPPPAGTPAPARSCGERLGIGDPSVACLTFIHGSSDAGPVDISIDGAVVFSGVAFGSSTGFVALPAGAYDVVVTGSSQPDAILIDRPDQQLGQGQGVEVAIVGSRESSTLTALTLPIDPATPVPGTASLRVVQAIPDAPPLDIGLSAGETLIPDLAPLTASGYLTIPATAASIDVRAAGSPDVLFPVPDFTGIDSATLTVYALGSVTNPTGIVLLTVLVPVGESQSPGTLVMATPAA